MQLINGLDSLSPRRPGADLVKTLPAEARKGCQNTRWMNQMQGSWELREPKFRRIFHPLENHHFVLVNSRVNCFSFCQDKDDKE